MSVLTEKQLRYMEFVQRETGNLHQTTEQDARPYALLAAGDLRSVDAIRHGIESGLPGVMSDDAVRNAQYLLVACCTLAGRAAMAAGMESERSNTASDLFIRKGDHLTSVQQIHELIYEMIRFYTLEVAALDKKKTYSRNIVRGLDYIYEHLHEPISVEDVARHVHVSRGYFSALFKQELGCGVAAYILQKRMEAARNMLIHSDMTYAEISQILAFSSQSHFIKVFKQHNNGLTPHEYRYKNN